MKITCLICFILLEIISIEPSLLVIYKDNSTTDISSQFTFNSPPYSLGNLNFPVSGYGIVVDACSNFKEIEKSNLTSVIALVRRVTSTCSTETNIFICARFSNCVGVVFEEIDRVEAGLSVWSIFDKRRPRSEFKVPLVSVTSGDFDKLTTASTNPNSKITLENDPNPWQTMFESVAFTLLFRVFIPIWCFISFGLATLILWRNKVSKKENKSKKSSKFCDITLNRVSLTIEAFCNLERFVYCVVDPVFSQQILPYIASNVLLTNNVTGKIVTNILMAFFLREVTGATYKMQFLQKMKIPCLFVASALIILDFIQSILTGLYIKFGVISFWTIKAIFFVILDIVLGFWYLNERNKFVSKRKSRANSLSRSSAQQKDKFSTYVFYCSVSMILFGFALILVGIPAVFGTARGYFASWIIITIFLQFSSTSQILVFGGQHLSGIIKMPKYSNKDRATGVVCDDEGKSTTARAILVDENHPNHQHQSLTKK